jgi:hypothetical protein
MQDHTWIIMEMLSPPTMLHFFWLAYHDEPELQDVFNV